MWVQSGRYGWSVILEDICPGELGVQLSRDGCEIVQVVHYDDDDILHATAFICIHQFQ